MPIEPIRDPSIPTSHLPFTPALRAGGFLFVSGQASVDDKGAIVSDTFAGEFRRSFDNVKRILAAAGLTLGDVVNVRSYVRDPADLAEYNKLYRELFNEAAPGKPFPTRTTITNCLPEILKYEVEVVAYAGK